MRDRGSVPVTGSPSVRRPWDDDEPEGDRPDRTDGRPMRSPPLRRGPTQMAAAPLPSQDLATRSEGAAASEHRESAGTPSRTIAQRLEEAMPLLVTAVGCAALAVALHLSNDSAALGRLELWGLFVALAIVAGAGAVGSMLIRDSDAEPDAAPDEPEDRSVDPEEGSDLARSPAPVVSPVRATEVRDPTGVLPGDTLWMESPADMEFGAIGEPAVAPTASVGPGSGRAPVAIIQPAEAIAEIDDLWTDLERLRHDGRRRAPA
jgi:hypothetical protein